MTEHTHQSLIPAVTVYSKPACMACDRTKARLTRAGVPYTPVDVTEDEDALRYVQELGYQTLPVVVTNDGEGEDRHWAGFRPDLLRLLATPHVL